MIQVLFFARYKETLKQNAISLDWQPEWNTLDDVRQSLVQRGEPWTVLQDPGLMCARNQTLCSIGTTIQPGDELAFFPTVTGG